VNDGHLIKILDGGHDAIRELLFGCNADMTQDGAGELGKKAFYEIEPGAMLGREGEFEAVRGLLGDPGPGLLGDVGGMIVEDDLDRGVGPDRRSRQA
jgi:hypothetical protein